jgi:hypothetical protein
MKHPLWASPPLWTMMGFLAGWLYAKPGVAIAIVWAVAYFAMLTWIMRDVEASKESGDA